ncbi:MAG: kinase-like domain-containing protein, partial [Olpidium bornovanus]
APSVVFFQYTPYTWQPVSTVLPYHVFVLGVAGSTLRMPLRISTSASQLPHRALDDANASHYAGEDVSKWSQRQVAAWLRENNFGQHQKAFAGEDHCCVPELFAHAELVVAQAGLTVAIVVILPENDITGDVLLELDNQLLKELAVSTVGQRNGYSADARVPHSAPASSSMPEIQEQLRKANLLAIRMDLGAKNLDHRRQISPGIAQPAPDDSATAVSASTPPTYAILRKFNITEDADKFALFLATGEEGGGYLSGGPIVGGRDLRKLDRTVSPAAPANHHDDFKRKDSARHKYRKLENFFGEKPPVSNAQTKLGKFFGERPPSELISSNLDEYFPGHNHCVLRKSRAARAAGISVAAPKLSERKSVLNIMTSSSASEQNPGSESRYGNSPVAVSSPLRLQSEPDDDSDGDTKERSADSDENEDDGDDDDDPGALIGMGSYGSVYLGLNAKSGELMAVKQVELPSAEGANEDRKRFMLDALQREIALLKDLNHVNIVRYLGEMPSDYEGLNSEETSDDKYLNIFLEYVPGGSVSGLLANWGPFGEEMVQRYVVQILAGLTYLHARDIIHRDIKGVRCTGIRRFRMRANLRMAPEVVKQTHYTQKADIWSLGCLIVEMFTAEHPFCGYTQMQAMFKIGQYATPNIPENISDEAKNFMAKTFAL